ncbi:hypothetical protein F909_02852 [Acinetobacter sp. ANC 3929]|uniref:ExeA family protein n=1 Tax=Acinetobacter sp. ANC 3929 TaxID=1217707 RepID=UPI0002D11740|nr:AAA family ATPase [Acinetobacter sp. ANC 3929]ENW79749.1 hypothetical protein F909_02852 [Acinetobacter sp. ANC 3929]
MSALKQLLLKHDLKQNRISKAINVSGATINLFVLHGQKPKKKQEQFLAQFIACLESNGIAKEDIQQALAADQHARNDQEPSMPAATTQPEEEQLMLLRKQTLTPAAKKKFKLFKDIFTEELREASELYSNPDINYVREAMWQCIKGNSTFIAVTGQSGAGKTTLHDETLDRIERERTPTIVIKPYVIGAEADDIKGKTLKASHIASAILRAVAPSVNPKRSIEALYQQIHSVLKESSRAGYHHVILIEEAHSLPLPTLKHLKRFIELKNGFTPLISVILIGQDELKIKLAENNPEVREVVQRCEIVTLEAFTQNQLCEYLKHRCNSAERDLSEFIDQSGLDAICEKLTRSVGRNKKEESLLYPLAVGNLLVGALNVAAELGEAVVTRDVVMEV